MDKLINITENNGIQVVSARELHLVLDVQTQFKDWMPRMLEYGFEENKDFSTFLSESTGGRPSKEYALTIDTAKEISMLQRTEKGKKARRYFIDLEKQLSKPKVVSKKELAQMVIEQEEIIERQQKQLKHNEIKIEFIDRVIESTDTIDIGQCAKILELNFGRNTLFKKLREQGVFFKTKNEPKQNFVERGYFKLKEHFIETDNHGTKAIIKVLVTQRGLGYLSTLFKANPTPTKPALLA